LKDLPELPPHRIKGPSAAVGVAAELAKKHPLARQWFFYHWSVVVLDPDFSKEIYQNPVEFQKYGVLRAFPHSFAAKFFGTNLITASYDEWKRHRKVANPVFEIQSIRKFEPLFARKAEELQHELKPFEGQPIPIQEWMQRFTLDCLGITCFDVDFHYVQDKNALYAVLYHRIMKELLAPHRNAAPFKIYDLLPLPSNRKLAQDIAQFNQLMNQVLEKKKNAHEARIDLCSQFIDASTNQGSEGLSTEEVRANLVMFFLAGYDTTATSLSSVLYHLAANPQIQEKVHEEIENAVRGDTSEIDPRASLELLNAVIQEATRLVPPVSRVTRVTTRPMKLGNYQIPKNMLVAIAIQTIQRLEREWPDPEKFDPTRFLKEGETDVARRSLAWQAFSNGPRMCIGRNFSMLEQRILISKFVLKYHILLPEQDPGRPVIAEAAGLNKVTNSIILKPRM